MLCILSLVAVKIKFNVLLFYNYFLSQTLKTKLSLCENLISINRVAVCAHCDVVKGLFQEKHLDTKFSLLLLLLLSDYH